MSPSMEVIESTNPKPNVYNGSTHVALTGSLPSYWGGVTMSIHFGSSQILHDQPEPRLTVNKNIHCGIPCVGVGNWPVAHILKVLASGTTFESLLQSYEGLRPKDIETALEAAAWVMSDTSTEWDACDLPAMLELRDELQEWQTLTDFAFRQSEQLFEDT